MRLTLVRHPAPAIEAGICYGSSDVAVSAQSLDAALAALAVALPRDAQTLYASPLQRCRALATPLAGELGLPPPRFDARLAEMDFGDWELRRWDDIPVADIDAWTADLVRHAPGGGEMVLQVAQRIAAFLDHLRRQRIDHAIVVCHAGTIRLLAALQASASIETAALRAATTPHRIDYGGVLTLQF